MVTRSDARPDGPRAIPAPRDRARCGIPGCAPSRRPAPAERGRIAPAPARPCPPSIPTVTIPISRAAASARTTLGERPGGGDAEQHVAAPAQAAQRALEHPVVAVVVAAGGQHRRIQGQRQGGPGIALHRATQPDQQFGRQVLAVRRRAAIAAEHQFAAGADTGLAGIDDGDDRPRQFGRDPPLEVGGFGHHGGEAVGLGHGDRSSVVRWDVLHGPVVRDHSGE